MKFRIVKFLLLIFVLQANANLQAQTLKETWQQAAKDATNGNYVQAISNYTKIIELKPLFTSAYTARGSAFCALGKFDEAIKDLSESIRLNPSNYLAYVARGSCYYGIQNFDRAEDDLTYFLISTISDTNFYSARKDAYKIRGLAYSWDFSFTNGIDDLTEALKYYRGDFEIYARRGYCYFRLKETGKALKDLDEAIRLNPKDADSLTTRSRIFSKKGSYVDAVQDLEAAIRSDGEGVVGYNSLAWILATCPDDNLRNGKRAVELATKACNLSKWKDYDYVDTLAAAYAESGDFDNALRYQKQAAAMDGIPEKYLKNVRDRVDLYLSHTPYRESESH